MEPDEVFFSVKKKTFSLTSGLVMSGVKCVFCDIKPVRGVHAKPIPVDSVSRPFINFTLMFVQQA